MKRILTATALTLLFSNLAFGLSIKASKHDFSSSSGPITSMRSDNQDQICVFCHTPHNAIKNVPLWNRSNPASNTFKLYTSSASSDVSHGTKSQLYDDSISLFCLSCHDGGVNPVNANIVKDAVKNVNPAINGTFVWTTRAGTNTQPANLTNDGAGNLTNDHPIGFQYPATDTAALHGKDTVKTAFGGKNVFYKSNGGVRTDQMECSSCHAVHDNAFSPFLRTSNTSSTLCLTCHIK